MPCAKVVSARQNTTMAMTTWIACTMLAMSLQTASLESEFEQALGRAELTTKTARLDENLLRIFRYGEFTSPLYDAMSENPWRIPWMAEVYRRQVFAAAGRPSDSLGIAGQLMGFGTRRTLVGDPLEAIKAQATEPNAMASVLARMQTEKLLREPAPSLQDVPDDVQRAAALVLLTQLRSIEFRRAAFAAIPELDATLQETARSVGVPSEVGAFRAWAERAAKVDMRALGAGGHDLALAAEAAKDLLAGSLPTESFDWHVDTVWGKIRLCGGAATVHEGPHLLILDTGGNDRYINLPANHSGSNWASVVLDTSGDDMYLSDTALAETTVAEWEGRRNGRQYAGPAGALYGYTCLIDVSGNDTYRSHRPGLASARFGFATLLDLAGNDCYEGYGDGLGFANFGAAVLEDMVGDDVYLGFNQVQGVGQTMGCGMLIDRAGNDLYTANDTVIDFPSPQSAEHNVSMAQGAGNGLRADYTHGRSLSGGVGILYDIAGDDKYSCGVFGQGVGYWKAVGMLWDQDGRDEYLGQWYAQGASAHFAIGYLDDADGADVYRAPMNMAQGAGHDFGVGMLVDRAGNDLYEAPNLSLGAGNANAIGVFVDMAGSDTYRTKGITLGSAAAAVNGSLRSRALCFGLFLDLGGDDEYPEFATWAKNAHTSVNWVDRRTSPEESQLGVFGDR